MSSCCCLGERTRTVGRRAGDFCISRQTSYHLARRYRDEGEAGLADRSRRPKQSPARTPAVMERLVLSAREAHPHWSGRKIAQRLRDLGHPAVPSPGTITEVLRRHHRLDPADSAARERPQRFERVRPNELWQMDFKGHSPLPRAAAVSSADAGQAGAVPPHAGDRGDRAGQLRRSDAVSAPVRFWREMYNEERPHEALGLKTPIAPYQPSRREFPKRSGRMTMVRARCCAGLTTPVGCVSEAGRSSSAGPLLAARLRCVRPCRTGVRGVFRLPQGG